MMHFRHLNRTRTYLLIIALAILCVAVSPVVLPGLRHNIAQLKESAHYGCLTTGGTALRDCIERTYVVHTETSGHVAAIAKLREDFKTFGTVQTDCHQFAHAIGRSAAKEGGSLSELFASGDSFCWSGYYHGVIEGLLRGTKISALDETRVRTFCDALHKPDVPYFDYFNCVHGVGHALMYVSNNDLPESTKRCAYFLEQNDQANCAAGVFMENLLSSQNGHHTSYIMEGKPFFPCTGVTDTHMAQMCYETQATQVTLEFGLGSKAFAACRTVSDTALRDYCYHGLGREISSQQQYDNSSVSAACMQGEDGVAPCFVGAAKNYVAYFHNHNEATALCATAPTSIKEACESAVINLAQLQTKTGI